MGSWPQKFKKIKVHGAHKMKPVYYRTCLHNANNLDIKSEAFVTFPISKMYEMYQ